MDDADPVTERFGLLHGVRRQKDGRALASVGAEEAPQIEAGLGIEADARLIQNEQRGIRQHRQADEKATAKPSRQLFGRLVAMLLQAKDRDQLVGAA